ncbi:MAG TPA: hypothetical protein VGJ11_10505 [Gaiellales bacterium]|jgi:hypothetical protein
MPYIANPVSMGVLLVLATVTIVLALMTGSTTWVIAGVCFVIFSAAQLRRWYSWPRRIKRD